MKTCVALLAFAAGLLVAPVHAAAGPKDPLAIVIATRFAPEPGEVQVRTRVEPDERSRELTIEWWTPEGFGGSHLITLPGDRAATWHTYFIKRMEAGEYEVAAVLKRNDGTEVRRKLTVTVVGEGGVGASTSPFSASR